MPTKFFTALLLVAFLITGTPVVAQTHGGSPTNLSPDQLQKIEDLNAAAEADRNSPLSRLWQIISNTSLTGIFVSRLWNMLQEYGSQRQLDRLNQLKEDRMNGLIKEARPDPSLTGKKDSGNVVAPAPDPTKTPPTVAPALDAKPATGSGVKGSSGSSIPNTSNTQPKTPDEDEAKKPGSKAGSAVITSFNDGIDGMLNWFGSFLPK